jgi:23S rRNA (cytosine1962-C5)-methyltransferase
MEFPQLILRKGEDRRLRAGHLWVFSNEVDTQKTPLAAFTPGQPVAITASNGQPLGTGYVNPHSLICARLVSRDPDHPFSAALIADRIKLALSLRERIFDQLHYRLVYGEGDGLPGVVVDRYGEVLVVQISTAGMERARDELIEALAQILKPAVLLLRNDTPSRALEGLASYVETAFGTLPERITLTENQARFEVPLYGGQKTGWYYDQQFNRERMQRYVKGRRVLDVFSYLGAWGIEAAIAGAKQVTAIEGSASAIEYIKQNAAINEVTHTLSVVHGDAFASLKALYTDGERFDTVILDPPAFIKRKKDLKEGLLAYQRLNSLAIQVLANEGILISSSCSYHLRRDVFLDILRRVALQLNRDIQVIEQGHPGPDHPVHPAIQETDYLKTYFCRVIEGLSIGGRA